MSMILNSFTSHFFYIDAIGEQVKQIEGLLLRYEDACENEELEKQKDELKLKLSQLVETKQ